MLPILMALAAAGGLFDIMNRKEQRESQAGQIGLEQQKYQENLNEILGNFDVAQNTAGFATNRGGKIGARKKIQLGGNQVMQNLEKQQQGLRSGKNILSDIFNQAGSLFGMFNK